MYQRGKNNDINLDFLLIHHFSQNKGRGEGWFKNIQMILLSVNVFSQASKQSRRICQVSIQEA